MREKRRLLDFVFSKSIWKDGCLIPTYRKPFDMMAVTNEACRKKKPSRVPRTAFLRYGSPGRTRTSDQLVNSQPLYRLSYRGIVPDIIPYSDDSSRVKCQRAPLINTFAKLRSPDRASVVERSEGVVLHPQLSTPYAEAHDGPCRTVPMPPHPSPGNALTPIALDHARSPAHPSPCPSLGCGKQSAALTVS